jgi:hypothetical protein
MALRMTSFQFNNSGVFFRKGSESLIDELGITVLISCMSSSISVSIIFKSAETVAKPERDLKWNAVYTLMVLIRVKIYTHQALGQSTSKNECSF